MVAALSLGKHPLFPTFNYALFFCTLAIRIRGSMNESSVQTGKMSAALFYCYPLLLGCSDSCAACTPGQSAPVDAATIGQVKPSNFGKTICPAYRMLLSNLKYAVTRTKTV